MGTTSILYVTVAAFGQSGLCGPICLVALLFQFGCAIKAVYYTYILRVVAHVLCPSMLNYLFCHCILSLQHFFLALSHFSLMKASPQITEHLKDETYPMNFSFFLCRQYTLLGQGLLFFARTVRASFLAVPCSLTGQKCFISSKNTVLLCPSFLHFTLQRFCYAE